MCHFWQEASFLWYLHKKRTLQLNEHCFLWYILIILNKLAYYLLQTLFDLPLNFNLNLALMFLSKRRPPDTKSHVTIKFGYNEVKVTHIFAKPPKIVYRNLSWRKIRQKQNNLLILLLESKMLAWLSCVIYDYVKL